MKTNIDKFEMILKKGNIDFLIIYFVDDNIKTQRSIDYKTLGSISTDTLIKKHHCTISRKLIKILKDDDYKELDYKYGIDCRFGILFRSENRTVFSFYSNRSGNRILINGSMYISGILTKKFVSELISKYFIDNESTLGKL